MNISTLILILKRQFFTKWGRFLLASGGIMIGIWAITLTTSLSLGLQNTVISAINSQSSAKQIYIGKLEGGKTDINIFDTGSKYQAVGKSDLKKIKAIEGINEVVPDTLFANNFLNIIVNLQEKSCFDDYKQIPNQPTETNSTNFIDQDKCSVLSFDNFLFQQFYESNRTKWVGKTTLEKNEIVLCFKCNNIGEKLGAKEPIDLLNKEITVEYANSPTNYTPGNIFVLQNSSFGIRKIDSSDRFKLTIGAVVDDRESQAESFGPPSSQIYINPSYYDEAIKLSYPDITDEEIGYLQFKGYIDSFDNLESVISKLNNQGYTAISFTKQFVGGISVAFIILTYVLSSLGIIAIIASIFGIINVMTISVLERKKEIGTLKSLGSRDKDILNIFLIESASLGVIGWIFGSLFAFISGFGITVILRFLIETQSGWKENLEVFNITNVTPSFPWWLILGTFAIAIISTVISGLIPAIKASRQNPIEVLRSE